MAPIPRYLASPRQPPPSSGSLPPPHALKPLQPPQQKPPRSMAAVSPLHLPPYEGGGFGGPQPPNNRTSSFAAALRKLAKQAVDPVAGEKDPSSPVSSPLPHTPKRPPSFLATHQGASASYGGGSSPPPPVVTIAPSRPVATHTADSRKGVDLSSAPPNATNTPMSNGHLPETMKMDSSKRHDKWEESTLSKSCSSSSTSQVRPHATIAPLPRPDDSVTSSRGFQPYRGGGGGGGSDDPPRNTLPHTPLG
ncbi:hypothetical protein JTE90_019388 [Oedothorax gibbosus]|uniref:Uncharacterized protein n=1 Tax=Oedothorax gibbosus TaxID=931172 RepID=A0AAV6UBB3_9ARAC|nr:hypothetical protein JTE90_019388 [Oedothorax gibbosus]